MLLSLSIENVAVIEKAEAQFGDGFNVLTGETGAGKSILIDSLSMVLGMRTSKELVRSGAAAASVSALFSLSPDLSDYGIDPEEDGSLLLFRRLSSDGRNVCRVNSTPVTLSILRAVGERLVSIHGQHDGIALLKPAFQASLLDDFAEAEPLLSKYRAAYRAYKEAQREYDDFSLSESDREQQKDILSFRIAELEKADLKSDEDAVLSSRLTALRNYSLIASALEGAYEALTGESAARDCLYAAMKQLQTAAEKDNSLSALSESLADLYYNTEDIAMTLGSAASSISFSPEELDEVESRLDILTRLKKKYNADIDTLIKNLDTWREEYDALSDYDAAAEKLRLKAESAKAEALVLGQSLEDAREKAALSLSKKIADELSYLDMPRSRFEVAFTPHEPDANGLRSSEFMLSTNPSEPLRPLAKIASGGEMSRIMLAIRSVLTGGDDIATLLFDEIDSGVSGRAALKIASKLGSLAKTRQIICITHLPQIAAAARRHLLVLKDTKGDSFKTTVTLLNYDSRVRELARLISGDSENAAAIAAAKDLIKS